MSDYWKRAGIPSFFLAVIIALPSENLLAAAPDVRQVRFSPDGQYVLAQDDTRITVLSTNPLKVVVRIPAPDAHLANFTPDSKQIAFLVRPDDGPAHLDRWSVADRARIRSTELPLPACGTDLLSPDGRYLACDDLAWTLWVFDVISGQMIVKEHLGFESIELCSQGALNPAAEGGYDPQVCGTRFGIAGSARLAFSSDSRFLMAAPYATFDDGVAWDLSTNKRIKWKGHLWLIPRWPLSFAFAGPDRMVFAPWKTSANAIAEVVAVPSGRRLTRLRLPKANLSPATDPAYVIVRPYGRYPVAAVQISTGRVITGSSKALDVLGSHYVTASLDGQVTLGVTSKELRDPATFSRQ